MKRKMKLNSAIFGAGLLGLTGCASTLAEVPLSDGNILVVSGFGTKSRVSQKCLTAEAVKQLTNSEIPDGVPKSTCYWVQMISTDSSDIAKAVTEFIRADDEFKTKIGNLVAPAPLATVPTPPPPPPLGTQQPPPGAEVASRILAAAVLQSQAEVVANAKTLPDAQKPEIKTELSKLRSTVIQPEVQKKLDAVLGAM